MNNNPNQRLYNLYLFLGIIVACIGIWQFIVPKLQASTGSGNNSNTAGTNPVTAPNSNGNGNTTSQACLGSNGHQLGSTLSDSNVYYREEFNTTGTWPEYESWLSPGTYSVSGGVNGFVWDFPASCTADQLRADANTSHNNRMNKNPGATGSVLEPNDPIVTSAFSKQ